MFSMSASSLIQLESSKTQTSSKQLSEAPGSAFITQLIATSSRMLILSSIPKFSSSSLKTRTAVVNEFTSKRITSLGSEKSTVSGSATVSRYSFSDYKSFTPILNSSQKDYSSSTKTSQSSKFIYISRKLVKVSTEYSSELSYFQTQRLSSKIFSSNFALVSKKTSTSQTMPFKILTSIKLSTFSHTSSEIHEMKSTFGNSKFRSKTIEISSALSFQISQVTKSHLAYVFPSNTVAAESSYRGVFSTKISEKESIKAGYLKTSVTKIFAVPSSLSPTTASSRFPHITPTYKSLSIFVSPSTFVEVYPKATTIKANEISEITSTVKVVKIPTATSAIRKIEISATPSRLKVIETPKTTSTLKIIKIPETTSTLKIIEIPKTISTPKIIEIPKTTSILKIVEIPITTSTPKTIVIPTSTKISTNETSSTIYQPVKPTTSSSEVVTTSPGPIITLKPTTPTLITTGLKTTSIPIVFIKLTLTITWEEFCNTLNGFLVTVARLLTKRLDRNYSKDQVIIINLHRCNDSKDEEAIIWFYIRNNSTNSPNKEVTQIAYEELLKLLNGVDPDGLGKHFKGKVGGNA